MRSSIIAIVGGLLLASAAQASVYVGIGYGSSFGCSGYGGWRVGVGATYGSGYGGRWYGGWRSSWHGGYHAPRCGDGSGATLYRSFAAPVVTQRYVPVTRPVEVRRVRTDRLAPADRFRAEVEASRAPRAEVPVARGDGGWVATEHGYRRATR